MKTQEDKTVELGELVLAIYDEAAQHSADPQEVSRLATQTVADLLWRHPRRQTRPRPARIRNCN